MKKITLLIILSMLFIYGRLFGQDQNELDARAKTEYEQADSVLNQIYQKLLYQYKNDVTFISDMKEAQRQWIKFRDAQVKMKYPAYKASYGSALPMCYNYYLKELTIERIKELRQWTDGSEEGDVCSGSVKIEH